MLENQEEYVWARWFNILKSERSSRMAKFLAETCCADGFPLRSNQDRVTREVKSSRQTPALSRQLDICWM
eukprot:312343-Rhodomonas_salina.3